MSLKLSLKLSLKVILKVIPKVLLKVLLKMSLKVSPILVEAKQNGIQSDFVQYLMGNLQHLGTLPDHVLHDIIKAKKKGWTALDSYLSSLKDGMGDGYASLLLPGEDDDVVIVAIDKQVDA